MQNYDPKRRPPHPAPKSADLSGVGGPPAREGGAVSKEFASLLIASPLASITFPG